MSVEGVGTPRDAEREARKALEGELWADIAVGKVDAYRDAVEARVKAELRERVAGIPDNYDGPLGTFPLSATVAQMKSEVLTLLDAGGPDAP